MRLRVCGSHSCGYLLGAGSSPGGRRGGRPGALAIAPAAAATSDLFISEYVEGSSNNKAIELFNGTGAAVDLAAGGYQLQLYFNGSDHGDHHRR